MAMRYEAYGVFHNANEWADILEVSPGTVRKHAKHPRNLELWISERVSASDDLIRRALEWGSPIEEQYDMARLLDLEWDLNNALYRMEQILHMLSREYAMHISEGDETLMLHTTATMRALKDRVVAIRNEWMTRCYR